MSIQKLNFRKKLLLAILPITAIALIVTSFLTYNIARKSIIEQTKFNLTQRANNDKHMLTEWIQNMEDTAASFADTPVVKNAALGDGIEEAAAYLKSVNAKLPIYEAMFVANTNGSIILDSRDGSAVGISIKEIPVFTENYDGAMKGKVHVGTVQASPRSGRPVILITAPIVVDGKVVGIMGTPVELNHYSQKYITGQKVGREGYAYITNLKGIVIGYPDQKQILKLDLSKYEFGRDMIEQKSGTIQYTFKGVEGLVAFTYMEKQKWIVAAKLNLYEVLEPIKKIEYAALAVGITSFVILFAVIIFVTGRLVTVLREVITNLSSGSDQISSASQQTAQSSQQMAQGANEQASNLEETSSSLEEMSAMIKQNAANSNEANSLSVSAREAAENGKEKMAEMVEAINKIKDSSDETSKIIKTIDEIAFQTNLLALNAAVEAARAGEAGKGFAVVAEEVRNLAQRSAEAAKNTSALIEASLQNAENGVQVTSSVGESLNEIFEGVDKVSHLVREVSTASDEQAKGIEQVNTAVAEMNKLTQTNAAHSEESASASEELSAQAQELNKMVDILVEVVEGHSSKRQKSVVRKFSAPRPSAPQKVEKQAGVKSVKPQEVIPLDDSEFEDF